MLGLSDNQQTKIGDPGMMRDRLTEATQLRETGRVKQDQAILEEARTLLLELVAAYPDDAEITYQTAQWFMTIWDFHEKPFLSTCGPSPKAFPAPILKER
jgi:hypothetical protein